MLQIRVRTVNLNLVIDNGAENHFTKLEISFGKVRYDKPYVVWPFLELMHTRSLVHHTAPQKCVLVLYGRSFIHFKFLLESFLMTIVKCILILSDRLYNRLFSIFSCK